MSAECAVTRREFIATTGTLLVAVAIPTSGFAQTLPRSLGRNRRLDAWVRIEADGTVTVFSGKVELGQGIRTAIAQVAADELDVSLERLRAPTVDTAGSPDEGRTTGSNSVPDGGTAMRYACAQARELLLRNAAAHLGVDVADLAVDDGTVTASSSGQSVTYWALLGGRRFDAEADATAEPKSPASYRYVGRSEPRLDLAAKFTGQTAYIQDIRLPGMLHARIVRGDRAVSQIESFDDTHIRGLPGVVSVVRDGNFLAVVAEREEQAIAAATALRAATQWRSTPYPAGEDMSALLRKLPTMDEIVSEIPPGDTPVVRELEAAYSRPFIAHASLGPSCSVAEWDGEEMTVWSHSQGVYPLRGAMADVLDLPETQIRVIHADGAGCYGHNGADDVACDAALIARSLPNRPIRLVWSREDEFCHEPYGSAMSLQLAAGLDASNRIVRWRHDVWSCSHSTRPAGGTAGGILAAREKADPLSLPPVTDGRQPTGGADRNAIPLYRFADQRVIEHVVLDPPLRNSALRSLGAHGNVFAIESFIDEIAGDIGEDPIAFRLRHLEDPRGRAVIERVRQMSTVQAAEGASGRPGRGFAFAQYKNLSSYLAVVVDIDVDDNDGRTRVLRAWAAVDVGQVINPDGVRNQIEGGLVQAASWTLKEQVRYTNQRIETRDWATYPILRFSEVPDVEVELIDRPDVPFVGAGEAAQGPMAAAIGNALANAVGVRLRDLPLTPDRVAAALRASG